MNILILQSQVLGYESPLYGRRTAQFKIEALSYRDTAVFHPELSDKMNAYIYGITGRIPHYINTKMHDYMGLVFEKMCRDYLMYYAEDLPFELAEAGQWWRNDPTDKKEVQIDIVGVPIQEANRKITEFLIGSCKFRNQKIGIDEVKLLEHYASVFGKGNTYYYFIFSLGGFTDELVEYAESNPVVLKSLNDIYKREEH